MKDGFGREIEYMRVSITDRCDLRCKYCMPVGCDKLSMSEILTYEEIERICMAAAGLGIRKIKVTGGEPFVRLGCTDLMRSLKGIDGIDEVTVTTNGQMLSGYIDELKDLGIDGVNVSLDTLRGDRFRALTGGGDIKKTIRSIEDSANAGIKTKINCLIQKDFNEDEITDIAEFGLGRGVDVRFIEMMPIGLGKKAKGISNEDVIAVLRQKWPGLTEDSRVHGNGPAAYYRIGQEEIGQEDKSTSPSEFDEPASIGLISSIHGKFCGECNRIRLTSTGEIKPCLCYDSYVDLRPYLAKSDAELSEALRDAILAKPKEHCFETMDRFESVGIGRNDAERNGNEQINLEERLMSKIGG